MPPSVSAQATLAIRRLDRDRVSLATLSALSCSSLDRSLLADGELTVARPVDAGTIAGAYEAAEEGALRRISGGGSANVDAGSLWIQLALRTSAALVPAAPEQLLNRYVRPLLRALGRANVGAHYFGRDWISVDKRPVGLVAFAHDAASQRCLFEAIVGVATPFATEGRASFRGKAPATLVDAARGVAQSEDRLLAAVIDAYAEGHASRDIDDAPSLVPHAPAAIARPTAWTATREVPIGVVGAARDAAGRVRVGGDLMLSRDAHAALETRLGATDCANDDDVGAVVDATLRAPSVVAFGLRTLDDVRDVIVLAATATTAASARDPKHAP